SAWPTTTTRQLWPTGKAEEAPVACEKKSVPSSNARTVDYSLARSLPRGLPSQEACQPGLLAGPCSTYGLPCAPLPQADKVVTLLDKIPNTSHGILARLFAALGSYLPGITNATVR